MKRTIFCLGMLLMILAFGVTVAACDIPKDELDGTTWRASVNAGGATYNYVLTFDNPNFTLRLTVEGYTPQTSGTYTISGKNVTLYSADGIFSTGTLSGNKLSFDSSDYNPLMGITFTKQ